MVPWREERTDEGVEGVGRGGVRERDLLARLSDRADADAQNDFASSFAILGSDVGNNPFRVLLDLVDNGGCSGTHALPALVGVGGGSADIASFNALLVFVDIGGGGVANALPVLVNVGGGSGADANRLSSLPLSESYILPKLDLD